jgi:hypothetical protein
MEVCKKITLFCTPSVLYSVISSFLSFFKYLLGDTKCMKPSNQTGKKEILLLTSDSQQL